MSTHHTHTHTHTHTQFQVYSGYYYVLTVVFIAAGIYKLTSSGWLRSCRKCCLESLSIQEQNEDNDEDQSDSRPRPLKATIQDSDSESDSSLTKLV